MKVRLLAVAVLLAASSFVLAGDAARIARDAEKAEREGKALLAYQLYVQAAVAEPLNQHYWAKARALRLILPPSQFRIDTEPRELGLPGVPPESESAAASGVFTLRILQEVERLASPVELTPVEGTRDFKTKGTARRLFETVANAFGMTAVFERDYPEDTTEVRFEIAGADYKEALYAVQRATNSFVAPISKRAFLVAVDTAQKRQDYEPNVSRIFEIPTKASVQEAQEMLALVQQSLELRRAQIDFQKRQIVVRDRRSKVDAAGAILHELLNYKAQVAVEVELIAFNENSTMNAGIGIPTSFSLINFGHNLAPGLSWSRAAQGAFALFGGGATFMGLGIADGQIFANVSKGESQSVIRAQLTSSDGQAATLHVGDRYPIVTSQYVGAVAKAGERTVAPPPSVTFEDLGLVLKVTPVVHGTEDISLELDAEFKTIGGVGTNGIPIISARKLQSRVRLKASEWAVVAGLASESDLVTLSGMAGLADVPILGKILSKNSKVKDNTQVLILIKPKLLSLPPGSKPGRLYWLGTETKPLSAL